MAANHACIIPGHGIILKSQFCGVVIFFEYGKIEDLEQATMEGKTLLNKS